MFCKNCGTEITGNFCPNCGAGILDRRTNTLITGDSLQLFGIFGSEDWACNIRFPALHLEAIAKLRTV